MTKATVNIVGAGLSGMSASIVLARQGIACNLISVLPSERAQSVLAEGGINGAMNTMGEDDTTENHRADTMRAGVFIADPRAVDGLTRHAPEVIQELIDLGVPFNQAQGHIIQRNFGGQKKKRTAYAKSSSGKIITHALIDEVRKFEHRGLIMRYPHHEFQRLRLTGDRQLRRCEGLTARDTYTDQILGFHGPVILACGGMNGVFPSMTTGTVANTGEIAAYVFTEGVRLGNLEMIQYHPTTIGISEKRCLVSEAARGEGGRLYIMKDGKPWYFMEEKFPEYGNLMPRDVVARESYFVMHDPTCEDQVYLDMTHLSGEIWEKRLPDLREEIIHYLSIDPKTTPIPVEPGIHYFMGGIHVDPQHRTNIPGLYASGECCCQYHGANRLGGNSLLGAIYGGKTAAAHLAAHIDAYPQSKPVSEVMEPVQKPSSPDLVRHISRILLGAMGIVRTQGQLQEALQALFSLRDSYSLQPREESRLYMAEAMLRCALQREESRGAHYRRDFPETKDAFRGQMVADYTDHAVHVTFVPVPEVEGAR